MFDGMRTLSQFCPRQHPNFGHLPAFGTKRLEDITTEGVERWAARLTAGGRMNNGTKLKVLTVLHGVMAARAASEAPA
jgi:hypothetical protein